MSDNPDAAPDAAPAEPSAGEQTVGDQPDVQAAPDTGGTGEVDFDSLPANVREYITELREEAKGNRKTHEPFKKAFAPFNASEQEWLLNSIELLGTDQEAGAAAIGPVMDRIRGIEHAAEEIAEEAPAIAQQTGISEAEVRQVIEQEKLVAQVEEETRSLGFEPGSEEALALWDMALALKTDDLAAVAPLVRQHLGLEDPNAAPEPEPEPEPEPAVEKMFPATPSAATGTVGTNADEPAAIPKLGSQELRDKVARRLAESQQPG